MTKFKVGDKVRILDASGIWLAREQGHSNGDITEVIQVSDNGHPFIAGKVGGRLIIGKGECRYIELVSDKPTKNQRITALESEVAELKAKVEALEKAQKPSYKIGVDFARNGADIPSITSQLAKLIEGEADKRRKKMSLTPNELRKAIITEAKVFVEDVLTEVDQQFGWQTTKIPLYKQKGRLTVKFHVNDKKRTVTALAYFGNLYPEDKEVVGKAIAKCAPDDVFNADIGKAIALGRALGLDVSRFEQAVKPTEVAVGTKVDDEGDIQTVSELIETPYKTLFTGEKVSGQAFNTEESVGWLTESQVTIIDDTGAKY